MVKNEDEVMVRVDPELLKRFREKHPELERLTYTAVVQVMLLKALEKEVQ